MGRVSKIFSNRRKAAGEKMFYVTMVDKFMSGWGRSAGKKNVLVFECESEEEAQTVAENASRRSEMIHVSIKDKKPYYPPARHVSWKNKETSGAWYKRGAFNATQMP